jgi:hypothetical protein
MASISDWMAPFFPIGFVAMWFVVLKILSVTGGWGRLATAYPTDRRPDGARFTMQSARFGFVSYNGCLQFTATPAGLFVAILLPWRPSHPPMFLPWTDILVAPYEAWLFRGVELAFRKQPGVRMRLPERLAKQLLAERPR